MYCGCIIHLKCYERAIGKTICPRFFSNNPQNETTSLNGLNTKNSNDDSFVDIQSNEFEQIQTQTSQGAKASKRSSSPSQFSILSTTSDGSSSTGTKGLVSSFFSGIRQRRMNSNNDLHTETTPASLTVKASTFIGNLTNKMV